MLLKQIELKNTIALLALLMLSMSVQASHRVLMFNDMATEKIVEMWPDFVESVDSQARVWKTPEIVQLLFRQH
jgi:hypothetical protein